MDKININEILDSDGNIMDKKPNKPDNKPSNANMSKHVTDYNVQVGKQRYGNNFLGRMGFHFYEDEDKTNKLLDDLAKIEFEQYKDWLNYFLKNFSKKNLKIWKDLATKDFNDLEDFEKEPDYLNAIRVLKKIKSHINANKEENQINEVDDLVSSKNDIGIVNTQKIENIDNPVIEEKIKELSYHINNSNLTKNQLPKIFSLLFSEINSEMFDITTKNAIISTLKNLVD